jgi:hypothetical protein
MTPAIVLVSWGARRLPACRASIDRLPSWVRVLEIRGHTEHELAHALPDLLADLPANTPVMIAPDDLVVPAQAIEAILDQYTWQAAVWCGWSNVDLTSTVTNVMLNEPPKPEPESAKDYDLLSFEAIATSSDPFVVGFNGFSLLTMPADLWRAPETRIVPCGPEPGWASDWSLCYRLAQQGIPITCEPTAFAPHFKVDYTRCDSADAWKRLDLINKSARWST